MQPIPSLLSHLRDAYDHHLQQLLAEAKKHPGTKNPAGQKGIDTPSQQEQAYLKAATLDGFVAFCEQYLLANPPVEVFYLGTGPGFRFKNNVRVTLCQQAEMPSGQMAPAGAIAVTPGVNIGDGVVGL